MGRTAHVNSGGNKLLYLAAPLLGWASEWFRFIRFDANLVSTGTFR